MGVLQIADCAAAKEKGRSGEVALRLSVGFEWQQGTAAPDDTASRLRLCNVRSLRIAAAQLSPRTDSSERPLRAAKPMPTSYLSTAPGFMIPFGSSAALIARIAASLAGSP